MQPPDLHFVVPFSGAALAHRPGLRRCGSEYEFGCGGQLGYVGWNKFNFNLIASCLLVMLCRGRIGGCLRYCTLKVLHSPLPSLPLVDSSVLHVSVQYTTADDEDMEGDDLADDSGWKLV